VVTALVFLLQSIAPVFQGATATSADGYTHCPDVDRLDRAMGVFYERVYYRDGEMLELDTAAGVPAELENSYRINHAASIFLLDPAGKLHAIFTPPHNPAIMIRDIAAIQSTWR